MPDSPLVTAVVVNLNGEAYLGDCLQSLFAQDYPALEVIVVDNGSTDSSVDSVIEPYGERINLIRNDRNLGFARGNNQAFERAKGEWMQRVFRCLPASSGAVRYVLSSFPLPLDRLHHRHDAGLDGFGQVFPSLDDEGQVRVLRRLFVVICTGFCSAAIRRVS